MRERKTYFVYIVSRLLYWESFDDVWNALDREKQLKGWRRAKKIALIQSMNPQWKDLSRSWYEPPIQVNRQGCFDFVRSVASDRVNSAQHDST